MREGARWTDDRRWRAALAIVVLAALIRLALAAVVPLVPDETYYWEWSRHLAAGYFDHPPMIALLVRAGTAVLGATPLGVRVVCVVAGALASVALLALARRIGGNAAALRAAIVLACLPLAAVGLVVATPDAALMLFAALALLAVEHAVSRAPGSVAATGWWLAAGVLFGAALVSKYPAALVGLGVAVACALRHELRAHLASAGPYLGVVLTAIVFAPVLGWNAHHDWVSFRFQLGHGFSAAPGHRLAHEGDLLVGQLLLASPLLFLMLVWATARALRAAAPASHALLGIVAVTVSALFVVSAWRRPPEANWPAPAYVPAIALLAASLDGPRARRFFAASCVLGALFVVAIDVQAIHPALPIRASDDPTAVGFGYRDVAKRVQAIRDARAPRTTVWLAGQRYQEASELAFHLPDHPTTFAVNVHWRPSEYQFWPTFPERAHPGDALILVTGAADAPGGQPVVDTLRAYFTRVSPPTDVALTRGAEVRTHRAVWVLEGWTGGWPPARVLTAR